MKKKRFVTAQNLQIIRTFLTLELSQYHKPVTRWAALLPTVRLITSSN